MLGQAFGSEASVMSARKIFLWGVQRWMMLGSGARVYKNIVWYGGRGVERLVVGIVRMRAFSGNH